MTMSFLSCEAYESDSFTCPFPEPHPEAAQGKVPAPIKSVILDASIYKTHPE